MKKRAFFIVTFILLLSILIYNYYPEKPLSKNIKFDSIVVLKNERTLYAYQNKELIKSYYISIGRNSIGPKQFEGDCKTPEGIYMIDSKNSKSAYHKNLGISYPNNKDKEYAKKYNKPPGSAIKIHGIRAPLGFIGKFHRLLNWTLGCIAVTNKEMDELYAATNIGTPILIKP
jgi:murein L,D-transpeptidase YafK